jgi:hypothetical protein
MQIVASFTEPRTTSPAWKFLNPETRPRIDVAPSELIRALQLEHDDAYLVALGLLVQVGDEYQPAGCFVDSEPPWYLTTNPETGRFRYEHDHGDLFLRHETASDLALRRTSFETTLNTTNVFVVGGEDDAEVVRALGLHAVPSKGLEALRRADVNEIFPDDLRSDSGWKYHLNLLHFELARLTNTPSAAIAEVIQRLADIQRVYSIDPGRRFTVVRPTDDQFEELRLATTFEDPVRIRQLLEGWATTARGREAVDWRSESRPPTTTFSAAIAALRSALAQTDLFRRKIEVSAALPIYKATGLQPVLDRIDVATNRAVGLERLELIAAGNLAAAYLASDPLVVAAEAVLADKPAPTPELCAQTLSNQMKIMTELRRLHRDRGSKR